MRSLALVIGGLVLASSVATAAAAQGIGDAARKERARRAAEPAKEPARVYVIDGSTSKDKGQSSDNAASPSGSQAGTAVAGEPTLAAVPTSRLTDGPTDSNGKSESYWRGRYASAQSAIAAADQQVKDIELRIQQHGPIVPGPTAGACSDGAVAGWGESSTRAARPREGRPHLRLGDDADPGRPRARTPAGRCEGTGGRGAQGDGRPAGGSAARGRSARLAALTSQPKVGPAPRPNALASRRR